LRIIILRTIHNNNCGRCGGLIVSVLISRQSGPGLSPGQGHCVVFLGKTLYSHSASPFSQVYIKWIPANLMLGVTLRWTSIPSRCSRNTPSHFMLQKPGEASAWWALGSYVDLTLPYHNNNK